jgi:alpha-L-fucosidase 2
LMLWAGLAGAAAADSTSGRWVLHNETPASDWRHAFPTGNGRLGTLLHGGPDRQILTCVQEELFIRGWDRGVVAVAEVADRLADVRRVIDGEDLPGRGVADAVREARRQLIEKGAREEWILMPHPALDLALDLAGAGAEGVYRRSLDLETGETRTVWQSSEGGVKTRVFSSREHNVNVVQMKATGGRRLNLTLQIRETPGRAANHMGFDLAGAFRAWRTEAAEGGLYQFADYAKDRGGYESVIRVETTGGARRVEGSSLKIEEAESVLLLMRIHPLDDATQSRKDELRRELAELPADYDRLLAGHAALHGEMFRRVTLDLGQADQWAERSVERLIEASVQTGITPLFLEQAFAMGRYLLISSCGRHPPPLQGIWAGDWSPAWAGGFVLDSNLNLAVSTVSIGHLPECAESYFSYIERLLPGWRVNARAYLGARGFLVSHYADPETGYLAHFSEGYPWMYWPGGAGWNLRPFYEHGLMTGDTQFMKDRVWPLYRELALFYEDYFIEGPDGRLRITPGISPENFTPIGLVASDTTFDLAVAREVFTILRELGPAFGAAPEDMARWKKVLERLPDYRINDDGALAEWLTPRFPDQYNHRHNSHLYGLFPGFELRGTEVEPRLRPAVREAVNRRLAFDTPSAHGLIHLAIMAARIHDADHVLLQLDRLSRRRYFHAGFVSSHDHTALQDYNLDASFSLPRVAMEALLFSMPGRIELMPAWHERLGADGRLTGVVAAGGFIVDMEWKDGRLAGVVITAGRDAATQVIHQDARVELQMKAGEKVRLDGRLQRQALRVEAAVAEGEDPVAAAGEFGVVGDEQHGAVRVAGEVEKTR